MCVDGGCQRARVPFEPLRQKEVSTRPIDVRDRRVPQRVERVEAVEPCLHLPGPEGELDAELRAGCADLAILRDHVSIPDVDLPSRIGSRGGLPELLWVRVSQMGALARRLGPTVDLDGRQDRYLTTGGYAAAVTK